MTLPASSKVVLTSGVTTLPKFTASNSTFELGTTSDNAYSGVSPSVTGSGNTLHIKNTLSSPVERSYSFGKAFPFNFISSDTTDVSGLSLTIGSGYSVPQGSVAIPQFANMSNELIISGVDLSDFEPTLKGYSHVDLKSGTLGYLNFSDSNVDVSVSEGVSFVGAISSVSNFFSVDGSVAALSLVGTLSTPWENSAYAASVDNAIDFNFASIDGFSINLGTGKVFDRFVHSVPGTITNTSFTLYNGWSACLGDSSLTESTLTFMTGSSFDSTDYDDPSDSVTCESGGVIPLSGSNNTLVLDGIASNTSDLMVGIASQAASSVNFGTSFSALSLKDGEVNSIDAKGVIVDYYNDFNIVGTNTVNSVNLPDIKLQNGTLVLYDGSTSSNSHKVREALDYAATLSGGTYEINKLIYAGATIDGDTFQLGTVDGVKSAFNSIEFTYDNSFTESEVTNSTLLLGEGVDSTFSVTSNSVDYSHDNTLNISGASGISLTSGILAPIFTKLDLVSGDIKSLDTTNMSDQVVELKGGVSLVDPNNFVLKMHDGRFIVSLDDDAGASDTFNDGLFSEYLTAFSKTDASGSTNSSGNELIIKNTFSPSNVTLGLGSDYAFTSVTSYDTDYTDASLSPVFENSIITLSSNAILPVLDADSTGNKLILDGMVLSNGLSDAQSTGYNSLVLKTGTLSANQSINTTGMSSSANVSLDDSFRIEEGSRIVLNEKNFTVNSCTSAADVVSVITGSGNTLNVLPTAGTCTDLDINLSSNSPFETISTNSKVSESTFYLGDGSIVPELHSDSSQNTLVVQGLIGDVDLSDTSAYDKVQLSSSNRLTSVNIPTGVDLTVDGSPTFSSDFAIIMSNASLHLNSSTASSDYYQRVLDSLDASFDGSDDTDLASNVTLVVDQDISGLDIKMGKNTATGGGSMYPITSVKTTSSGQSSPSSFKQSTSGSISDSSVTLYEGSTVPSFTGSNDTLHVDTYNLSSITTPSSFSTVNFTANSVVESAVIQANSPTLNNYSDSLKSVTLSGGVINLFTQLIPEVTGSHVDLYLNDSVSASSTTINLGFGHALDSLITVDNATLNNATIHVNGDGSVFDLATNVQVSGHGNTLELSNLRLDDSVLLSDTSTYQSLVLSKSTVPSAAPTLIPLTVEAGIKIASSALFGSSVVSQKYK